MLGTNDLVCIWGAFERYKAGDSMLLEKLRSKLAQKLDDTQRYAVRSSANLDDGHQFSFAGQFQTRLDVHGTERLVTAIKSV